MSERATATSRVIVLVAVGLLVLVLVAARYDRGSAGFIATLGVVLLVILARNRGEMDTGFAWRRVRDDVRAQLHEVLPEQEATGWRCGSWMRATTRYGVGSLRIDEPGSSPLCKMMITTAADPDDASPISDEQATAALQRRLPHRPASQLLVANQDVWIIVLDVPIDRIAREVDAAFRDAFDAHAGLKLSAA